MCGRFSLRLPHNEIRRIPGHGDLAVQEWINEDQFVPRYNIAPRTQAPILRRQESGLSNTNADSDSYILQSMKWGLVPHWSKFEDKTLNTTNARAENLVESGGMWASIKGKKRCAVLCQGYYEWLTKGREKLPHFVKHKCGKLMLMAGLYDCVILEGQSSPLWTFTIVTTAANRDFTWLHDRQPVILSTRELLDIWLDTSSQTWMPKLTELVKPYHDVTSPLECYQVPKEVGKVGKESSTFIEPVANRRDGILAMFSKQVNKSTTPQHSSANKKRPRGGSPGKTYDLTVDSLSSPPPLKNFQIDDDNAIADDGPSMPKKVSITDLPAFDLKRIH